MLGNWWRTLSYETKAGLAVVGTLVLGIAGYIAATGLSKLAAEPAAAEEVVIAHTETVQRLVTVMRKGERPVVRTVQGRVVRRVVTQRSGPEGTAVEYVTVTTPGRVAQRVVRDRRDQVVTLPASVRTIVETRGGTTRTTVVTNERVLTTERVFTTDRVVTNNRTVTDVRTEKETVPVTTVRTVTERVPVTETFTVTATTTATQLLTQTVTQPAETLPPVTVTVTVKCPPKGC